MNITIPSIIIPQQIIPLWELIIISYAIINFVIWQYFVWHYHDELILSGVNNPILMSLNPLYWLFAWVYILFYIL
jgi:hypothetical protein